MFFEFRWYNLFSNSVKIRRLLISCQRYIKSTYKVLIIISDNYKVQSSKSLI